VSVEYITGDDSFLVLPEPPRIPKMGRQNATTPHPPGGFARISIHWSYLGTIYKSVILKELSDCRSDGLIGRPQWCDESAGSSSRYILACGCKSRISKRGRKSVALRMAGISLFSADHDFLRGLRQFGVGAST
jgi:hypothetical protein